MHHRRFGLTFGLGILFSSMLAFAGAAPDTQASPDTQQASAQTDPATAPATDGSITPPSADGSAAPAADGTSAAAPTPATPPAPPPLGYVVPADFDGPTADIVTSMGTITLALDEKHAPKTVKNFISYARSGRFNKKVIYRVEPGFVVQMGCVDDKDHGCRQSKPVPLESNNGLSNVRGAVAMAHGDKPDSATSEFFIDLMGHPELDAVPDLPPNTSGFAVFAHVMKGMDILDKIANLPTKGGYGPFPDAAPKKIIHVWRVVIHMPKQKKAGK